MPHQESTRQADDTDSCWTLEAAADAADGSETDVEAEKQDTAAAAECEGAADENRVDGADSASDAAAAAAPVPDVAAAAASGDVDNANDSNHSHSSFVAAAAAAADVDPAAVAAGNVAAAAHVAAAESKSYSCPGLSPNDAAAAKFRALLPLAVPTSRARQKSDPKGGETESDVVAETAVAREHESDSNGWSSRSASTGAPVPTTNRPWCVRCRDEAPSSSYVPPLPLQHLAPAPLRSVQCELRRPNAAPSWQRHSHAAPSRAAAEH